MGLLLVVFGIPLFFILCICYDCYESYKAKKEEKKQLEKYYRRYPWVRPHA